MTYQFNAYANLCLMQHAIDQLNVRVPADMQPLTPYKEQLVCLSPFGSSTAFGLTRVTVKTSPRATAESAGRERDLVSLS